MLVSLNYQADGEMKNFASVLSEYGVTRVTGLIAEGDSDRYYQNPFYLLPDVASSAYTSSVGSNYIFAPYVQGVSYPESSEDITYTPLLTTSDSAVAKADTANATTYAFEEGDAKGPFTIGLLAERQKDGETNGRLIVYGSFDIFSDSADQMVSGTNSGMFADVLSNFVQTEDAAAVVIPVKSYETAQLVVTAFLGRVIGLSILILLPVLLLLTGIVIWAKRRKR